MPIFPPEVEQYQYAQISLNRYIDEGYHLRSDWELRGTVRKDVMRRAKAGIPVRKVVYLRRRHPDLQITTRQVQDGLRCLHKYTPYNKESFAILKAIDEIDSKKGFNSAEVALAAFGPSDKEYQEGEKQQSIKWKLRNMQDAHLLRMHKRRYYKLPVWDLFYKEVKIIEENWHADNILQL